VREDVVPTYPYSSRGVVVVEGDVGWAVMDVSWVDEGSHGTKAIRAA